MDKFTIFCTKEQIGKALTLGASIKEHPFEPSIIKANEGMFKGLTCITERYYITPTAEQMCGWLRTKGCFAYVFPVRKEHQSVLAARCSIPCDGGSCDVFCSYGEDNSVILKAIDEALNYLIRQQNNVR